MWIFKFLTRDFGALLYWFTLFLWKFSHFHLHHRKPYISVHPKHVTVAFKCPVCYRNAQSPTANLFMVTINKILLYARDLAANNPFVYGRMARDNTNSLDQNMPELIFVIYNEYIYRKYSDIINYKSTFGRIMDFTDK